MLDVLVAGAGPAGSIAAIVLARAGARVLVVDREPFPRDKLCGDTLNPGAVRLLGRLGLAGGPLSGAGRLQGMVVTGPQTRIDATYGGDTHGLAVTRRQLDAWLLEHAIRAGARFEAGFIVRHPLVERSHGVEVVRGLVLTRPGETLRLPATLTVGADGRRSVLAREVGLTKRVRAPRRWAFGTYVHGVRGMQAMGEMHVRHGWYIGLAPMPDGTTNVCVVTTPPLETRRPLDVIRRAIASDEALAARFSTASFGAPVRVLGPLAAEVRAPGVPGLLLAGDAAGFVDPMTGDGLRLAMAGGMLSAREALRTLESGDYVAAIGRLADARAGLFGRKIRFNRWLRRLVASPRAVDWAGVGARVAPSIVRRAVRYAGDVS